MKIFVIHCKNIPGVYTRAEPSINFPRVTFLANGTVFLAEDVETRVASYPFEFLRSESGSWVVFSDQINSKYKRYVYELDDAVNGLGCGPLKALPQIVIPLYRILHGTPVRTEPPRQALQPPPPMGPPPGVGETEVAEQPPICPPPEDAENETIQGRWRRLDGWENERIIHVQGTVIYEAGSLMGQVYQIDGVTFLLRIDSDEYIGVYSDEKLSWSDGDVWEVFIPPPSAQYYPSTKEGRALELAKSLEPGLKRLVAAFLLPEGILEMVAI